ncbi:MAG: DUF4410 domain-containing protein [Planctomycetota bacterium]|nr:DUF4410 domain-containing protein [Planctomycetota bacterium]
MKRMLLAGLLATLAVSTGCVGTIAKQAYYGATGASGRYFELRDLGSPGSLDRFQGVQVEAFDPSLLLGAIPPDVVGAVQPDIIERLTKANVFAEVGARAAAKPLLIIRGKFMDYDPGGSAVRAVFGTDPTLTAQIYLIDAATNQTLGVAMVTGTVKSVVRANPKEMASGMSKAVKGLLAAHMTRKPQKDED